MFSFVGYDNVSSNCCLILCYFKYMFIFGGHFVLIFMFFKFDSKVAANMAANITSNEFLTCKFGFLDPKNLILDILHAYIREKMRKLEIAVRHFENGGHFGGNRHFSAWVSSEFEKVLPMDYFCQVLEFY